jgi:hypothetical protein
MDSRTRKDWGNFIMDVIIYLLLGGMSLVFLTLAGILIYQLLTTI